MPSVYQISANEQNRTALVVVGGLEPPFGEVMIKLHLSY
jgi:hypothetical protein